MGFNGPLIEGLSTIEGGYMDCWTWHPNKTMHYLVKEEYIILMSNLLHPTPLKIWKLIWNREVIPKVNSFCWMLIHKKIITTKNLRCKNIHDPLRCLLCNCEEESIYHLFYVCSFSLSIWKWPLKRFIAYPSCLQVGTKCFKIGSTFVHRNEIQSSLAKRAWTYLWKFLC